MDREQSVRALNDAISREYNSVAEYVLHSSPFTVPGDDGALKAFGEIRDAQAATASWLTTRLREDFGAGPTLRAFEYWKRDLNYLSVPYLARFAADHYAGMARRYGELLAEAAGEPALAAVFTRLRDESKSHAEKIGAFAKQV